MQALPQLTSKIKTMRLSLPHLSSLDVLPSPTDKWSTTTHPIKGEIFGFVNLQFHTKTSIFIKAASFTPRRSL